VRPYTTIGTGWRESRRTAHVTRRSRDGDEQTMVGLSVTVGERVVTVHLRREKETRTFDSQALVSIETF